MISYLTDAEIKKIRIQFQENTNLSEEYIKERESIWNERITITKKLGKNIWNGIIYTIDKFLQIDDRNIHMSLNTCEFKDIVFRINKGIPYIIKKYGISYISKFITLDCIPITTDGKFVFGLRGNNTNVDSGSIGLIGGTANKDEMEIHSFNDFTKFMINEIEEETLANVRENKLTLFSINQFNGKYEFLYKLALDIDSSEIHKIHKNDEFNNLLCLTAKEVQNYNKPMLDAFIYAKTYIQDLEEQIKN